MNHFSSPLESDVEIPMDRRGANWLCLRSCFSVFQNIPSDEVFNISGHACISLKSVLDKKFAEGVEFSFMKKHGKVDNEGFNGTPRAAELLKELEMELENGEIDETCFGHLMFWSDSFLRFPSRQDEHSIWLFVVRISPPQGLSTSTDHTVCLAMGNSKEDHDPVIVHYMKEVQELMRGKVRYHGGLGKDVNTSFGVGLYIADTPERNAILHRLHLGLFGKRCCYAGKIDPVGLPSCDLCFKDRVCRVSGVQAEQCLCQGSCCDWDQLKECAANKFDKTEGTKYPTTCSPSNPHRFPKNRTTREECLEPIK